MAIYTTNVGIKTVFDKSFKKVTKIVDCWNLVQIH